MNLNLNLKWVLGCWRVFVVVGLITTKFITQTNYNSFANVDHGRDGQHHEIPGVSYVWIYLAYLRSKAVFRMAEPWGAIKT